MEITNLIYKTDYHGFVYLWFDTKRKRYYLGSHMGSVDDGYVCSSFNMRRVHKKRPNSFKRRILHWHKEQNLKALRTIEDKWLKLIKPEELKKKYHNRSRHAHHGFGWNDPKDYDKHVSNMRKSWTPERKAAHSAKMQKKWQDQTFRAKFDFAERSNKRIDTPEKKQLVYDKISKAQLNKEMSDETKSKMSEAAKARCTPEWSKERGELMRKGKEKLNH